MQRTVSRRPKITVSADGTGIVSQAGGVMLTQTLRATGLDAGLTTALRRWRPRRAVHDPGKTIADLAVTLALGGDCLADIAMLRAETALFGPVASDPVVSRLVSRLASDAPRALKAIRAARAAARERAWELAGDAAPGSDGGLITVDIDATVVTSCSGKDQATPTWKKTSGSIP
jgi:Transposase DDE domain group 1